jgi:hypothetical protein
MKFDDFTIKVLRNFSSINPSIQFLAGNVLRTISPNKTVMAKATLENNVESTFAIYDLNRFLGVLSLFDNPNIELGESKLTIKQAGKKVDYTYADPSIIILPPRKDIILDETDLIKFQMTEKQFSEIMKALGVLSFPEIVILGENGKIILRATDTKNPSSDKYDIEVGETDKTFKAVFKSENLKLMSDTYTVSISPKMISNFIGKGVEYWVAVESNSKF